MEPGLGNGSCNNEHPLTHTGSNNCRHPIWSLGITDATCAKGLVLLFNLTAAKDSTFTSFDRNDYNSILESGLMVFGASPVEKWDDPVSVSRAIRENVKNNTGRVRHRR
mgnify:CR=1 FL=1